MDTFNILILDISYKFKVDVMLYLITSIIEHDCPLCLSTVEHDSIVAVHYWTWLSIMAVHYRT